MRDKNIKTMRQYPKITATNFNKAIEIIENQKFKNDFEYEYIPSTSWIPKLFYARVPLFQDECQQDWAVVYEDSKWTLRVDDHNIADIDGEYSKNLTYAVMMSKELNDIQQTMEQTAEQAQKTVQTFF